MCVLFQVFVLGKLLNFFDCSCGCFEKNKLVIGLSHLYSRNLSI